MEPIKADVLIEGLARIQSVGLVEHEIVETIEQEAEDEACNRCPRIDIAEQQARNKRRQNGHGEEAVQLLQEIDDALGILKHGYQRNGGHR